MAKFIHVGLTFPGVPKVRDLEPAMLSVALDWLRYSQTSWILWSERTPTEIYSAIKPHLDINDLIMVFEMIPGTMIGFEPPWVWTWLNSKNPAINALQQNQLRNFLIAPPPPPPDQPSPIAPPFNPFSPPKR